MVEQASRHAGKSTQTEQLDEAKAPSPAPGKTTLAQQPHADQEMRAAPMLGDVEWEDIEPEPQQSPDFDQEPDGDREGVSLAHHDAAHPPEVARDDGAEVSHTEAEPEAAAEEAEPDAALTESAPADHEAAEDADAPEHSSEDATLDDDQDGAEQSDEDEGGEPDADGGEHDGERIAAARDSGGGAPVPPEVRRRVELTTTRDLASVRVHTGEAANMAAQAANAQAFAVGQDVFFASGQLAPGTPEGDKLLAHELAHTVQQRGANPTAQAKLATTTPGDAAEHEADAVADHAVGSSQPVAMPVTQTPAQIARKAKPARAVVKQAPLDRKVRMGKPQWAQQDRYNRGGVRANRLKNRKTQIDRAGVRVNGRDQFSINEATAPRFTIVSGSMTRQLDVVKRADIKRGSRRLAINPAHTRKLLIGASRVDCVLTWHGSKGAAWLPIKSLKGDQTFHTRVKADVNKRARTWQPKAASVAHVSTFLISNGANPKSAREGAAKATERDERRYIRPNQKAAGGNQVADYLQTENRGSKVNITLNLPSPGAKPGTTTAPVAVDVAQVGDHFFVPHGRTFVREISVFKRRATRSNERQTWVYGFVGKNVNGKFVPDPARRGWVPLRMIHPKAP